MSFNRTEPSAPTAADAHLAQDAARRLAAALDSANCVVRLLDDGRIPSHRTGTHRRVLLSNVLAFKKAHRRARSEALDRLSDLDQELGLV